MKHTSLFFPVALVALMALVASSSGVAEEQGRDRTGAPGSYPVCTSCHNNGTASISASFEILDWNTEEAVTEYLPGQDYLVRMVVAGGDASLNYGVQATAVSSRRGSERCRRRRRRQELLRPIFTIIIFNFGVWVKEIL